MQMGEAVRALSNEVNLSILREYKGIYGYVGVAGTTPFATNTDAAIQARKVLHSQRCPRENRRMVLDFEAEANALALAAFQDVDKAGDAGLKREGEVGRKFGFDIFTDDHVLTHTSTPLTAGAATVNGAHVAGVKAISIAKATNASLLVEGDVITFAGDEQTYVVTAAVNLAVGNTTVSISPGLQVAKTGGEAMSLKASHVVNLAFHRDAFAFANRPLVASAQDLSEGRVISLTDAQTGITMRLERLRQYKQSVWDLDLLWGRKLVRPELACRVAG